MKRILDRDAERDERHGRPHLGYPMNLTPKRTHVGTLARVSPAAAPGPRVVSLNAWREARESSARTRSNVGATTASVGARSLRQRPDRLGVALAWCRAFTAGESNPFDPARLRGGA